MLRHIVAVHTHREDMSRVCERCARVFHSEEALEVGPKLWR